MSRKRYVPDLREMQSLAERNYAAALGLMSDDPKAGETRTLALGEGLQYQVKTLQVGPYTTDIQVLQQASGQDATVDYLQARFVVRLYHDMQLAEMIESQGLDRFAASYEQPNPNMHQRDEKRQINHFLADWLRLCFRRGRWHDMAFFKRAAHDDSSDAITNDGMTFGWQIKRCR